MLSHGLAYVRKRDFQISFDLGLDDQKITDELAQAVRSVRVSRMHNVLLLEVAYPVDGMVHHTLEYMCKHFGPRRTGQCYLPAIRYDLTGRSHDAARPGLLSYHYEDGTVIDQYEISSREEDADEPLLDVLQISFDRKHTTTRRWLADAPRLVLVENAGIFADATDTRPN